MLNDRAPSISTLLAPIKDAPNSSRSFHSNAHASQALVMAYSRSFHNSVASSSSLLVGANLISTHDDTKNMSLDLIRTLEKLLTKVAQAFN
jgi:hypothetical protein